MKETIRIITLLILAFLLPLVTSLLLDWQWIDAQAVRRAIVILLMVVEFAICVSLLTLLIKSIKFKK